MKDSRLPQLRPTGNRDQDVFQREVVESLGRLKRDPLLDYTDKRGITVTTSDTPVAHGLGRIPVGWIITDRSSNAVVWRVSWDSQFVTLRASGAVTVSLRFF